MRGHPIRDEGNNACRACGMGWIAGRPEQVVDAALDARHNRPMRRAGQFCPGSGNVMPSSTRRMVETTVWNPKGFMQTGKSRYAASIDALS